MPTFRTLKRGDVIKMGYRGHEVAGNNTFLGFSDVDNKYGNDTSNLPFATLKEVHEKYNTRSIPKLEAAVDNLNLPYGQGIYAVFKDNESNVNWTAYIFEGSFCVGSSADKMQFFS